MKVDRNKGICTDFCRNVLDCCRDDRDDIPLGDPAMNLPPRHLQDLPCLSLVLICLEFIIKLIESACLSLLLPNIDPHLCKKSRPSVTFMRDLNPSYVSNDYHLGKSHIICIDFGRRDMEG